MRRKLRYPSVCCRCATPLAPGTEAVWDAEARTATCTACADDPAGPVAAGVPGRSAGAEAERRRARQRAALEAERAAHPVLARLRHALDPPKDPGRSWATGQVGEEKLGAALDAMCADALALHDRRLPRSRANIDHLVVAPTGVWVIDAKRYAGRVARGSRFDPDVRLTVAGRNQTRLVEGVCRQVRHVEQALAGSHPCVPLRGVLCFVDSDWALFAKPFTVDGVLVTWGKALRQRLAEPGPLDAPTRTALHHVLARAFPPA